MAAATIFAVDPRGSGVLVRARTGPVRERWLGAVRRALPSHGVVKTLLPQVAESRLIGGLDLDASLGAGRAIAARGLLADADGGVVIAGMAERLSPTAIAHLSAAMDEGCLRIERDGISLVTSTRFGMIALDEGIDDEAAAPALADRLALHLDLDRIAWRETEEIDVDADGIAEATARLAGITVSAAQIEALVQAAAALGIASLRAPLQALRVARAAAALRGQTEVAQDDIALAARLVLAPRATIFPQTEPESSSDPPPEPPPESNADNDRDGADMDRPLDEVVVAAAQAAIPADVLAALQSGGVRQRERGAGKAGAFQRGKTRGRPTGTRRGDLRSGGKLNIIETLRAAAPWQTWRRTTSPTRSDTRLIVRPDDFRITRFRQRSETATIFVVDASGSAALHRLAEAKGAVELLLADCYVRRDQVALIAFRGAQADILLPPTRSLTRAKRSLSGLPGGGGTPLAAGLDAAMVLADAIRRKGQTPSVIVLTDGRANVARDGSPGRPRAEEDAKLAAQSLRAAGIASVLIDTSARPSPAGAEIAASMNARYLPLPYADAAALSKAVKAATT
jgi:magnesium chelatase subunit D